MSRDVPGPLRRLWRQPLRAGAIALLAVTALAASGIQSAAALLTALIAFTTRRKGTAP